jgi:hypothetical protein
MRAPPCARLSALSDTLTNASMLPGDGMHYPQTRYRRRCDAAHTLNTYDKSQRSKPLKS